MIRFTTILWLTLVACVGVAMFKVKYEVQLLDDELVRVQKQTATARDEIHVLNAEWSFLNQPTRLADLARKYLALQPIGTAQYGQMSQLQSLKMKPVPMADTGASPLAASAPPTQVAAGPAAASAKRTPR
jgi:cell division protein FtsL